MSTLQHTHISELVTLITNASQSVEQFYATQSPSKPNVPSLNDLDPHPLDEGITPSELRHATQVIEGACAQLCASIARPQHTMLNRMMETFEMSCYHVALKFKITDILANVHPPSEGMDIDELAQRAGLDKSKLRRILRLLISRHVYTEVKEDVFANNRLSLTLHSSSDLACMAGYLRVRRV